MAYNISLYISLAILLIGLIYRVFTWFSLKTTVDSMVLNTDQGSILFTNAGPDRTRCRLGRPLPPT